MAVNIQVKVFWVVTPYSPVGEDRGCMFLQDIGICMLSQPRRPWLEPLHIIIFHGVASAGSGNGNTYEKKKSTVSYELYDDKSNENHCFSVALFLFSLFSFLKKKYRVIRSSCCLYINF
jgi:hypothetical protein